MKEKFSKGSRARLSAMKIQSRMCIVNRYEFTFQVRIYRLINIQKWNAIIIRKIHGEIEGINLFNEKQKKEDFRLSYHDFGCNQLAILHSKPPFACRALRQFSH